MTQPLLVDEDVCVFCFKEATHRIRINVIGRDLPLCKDCLNGWYHGDLSVSDMKKRFCELKSMGMME